MRARTLASVALAPGRARRVREEPAEVRRAGCGCRTAGVTRSFYLSQVTVASATWALVAWAEVRPEAAQLGSHAPNATIPAGEILPAPQEHSAVGDGGPVGGPEKSLPSAGT